MLNWLVRIKNRNFWIGLIGVIGVALGVDASMFTSWSAVTDAIIQLINNPYMIGCLVIAVWGYVQDFTTKGFGDSELAKGYTAPKGDKEVL